MVDAFFAAEIDTSIATIDLHTTTNVRDAIDLFERELARYAKAGAPYVRVVHGIGSGALRDALERVVANHPLVVDYRRDAHGGSTVLLLIE